MNKKSAKEILLLLVIIIFCAITARYLKGNETLEDYAKSHSSNTQPESPSSFLTTDSAASDHVSESASYFSTDQVNSSVTNSTEPPFDIDVYDTRVTYDEGFYYEELPSLIISKITDVSYPQNCPVPLEDLRYCSLLYINFDGETESGEMICNKAIADDIMEIFHELYNNNYRIEKIKLIDEFDADDEASMKANNTSCFNYRNIGKGRKISQHAYGLAIDLNPLYNPQIKYKNGSTVIYPQGSEIYADRNSAFPYKIDKDDLAYKLFKEHNFSWGGNWNSSKDYQHFEKKIR